jgi:serine/threonine protein kinase
MAGDETSNADGEAFGPYLVRERLGVGGMATVHRAIERGIEGFERSVALKRLLPHLAEDEKFVRAFVREAKLASMLAHPHVVQIFELGRVGPVYFISMEMIEGHDVRKILRQSRRVTGPPPVSVVVSLLTQSCDALEYAHTRADDKGEPLGLVHRDVSPSNLLVTHGGHVKVIDFGIAKASVGHLRTQTGHVKGKMAYMSPEAIGGKELDARSDLFSLGVVAHELVTARPLFATKNEYQTLLRVQKAAVAPPSTYNQDCPAELDAIIMRALERNRDHRWASAADMREQLIDLALRYNLNAGPRVVSDWMQWAFAMGDAPRGELSGKITMTGTPAVSTPRPFEGKTPPPAVFFTKGERDTPNTGLLGGGSLPPAEDEDDVIEIAWGGRAETPVPVVIEGITDYSGGVVAVGAVEAKSKPNLVYMPPEPTTEVDDDSEEDLRLEQPVRDGKKATGSGSHPLIPITPRPPLVTFTFPTGTESSAKAVPMPELTPTPAPLPVAPRPTPVPFTPAPQPPTPSPPTPAPPAAAPPLSIGSAIIAREQKRFPVLALALIAGAAAVAGVATYILLFKEPPPPPAAAADPATPAPAAAPTPAAPDTRAGRLVVRSTPAGMEVSIDGALVDGVTPIGIDVAPGRHLVAVESDGEVLWRDAVEVVPGGHFELHPVVVAPSNRSDKKRDRDRARYRAPTLSAPEPVRGDAQEQLAAPAPAIEAPAAAIAPPPVLAPAAVEPPARKQKVEPVLVPPNAVSKRSGSVPTLRARGSEEIPERISAQLCIDGGGKVISAKLLTTVPAAISGTLSSALRGWRYSPYKDSTGARVPACFAVTFKTR